MSQTNAKSTEVSPKEYQLEDKTYVDVSELPFWEGMKMAFRAGREGKEIVTDWMKVNGSKEWKQIKELVEPLDVLPNQKCINISLPKDTCGKQPPQDLSWTCEYCGKSNDAQEPACRGCGAPNPQQGETSGTASKKVDVFMDAVVSSVIAAIGYDEYAKRLVVRFKSGAAYEYLNIPKSLYAELMAAEAKGKFYSAHIRGKFDGRKL